MARGTRPGGHGAQGRGGTGHRAWGRVRYMRARTTGQVEVELAESRTNVKGAAKLGELAIVDERNGEDKV